MQSVSGTQKAVKHTKERQSASGAETAVKHTKERHSVSGAAKAVQKHQGKAECFRHGDGSERPRTHSRGSFVIPILIGMRSETKRLTSILPNNE